LRPLQTAFGTVPWATCVVLLAACQSLPVPSPPRAGVPNWTDEWQAFALPGKRATVYSTEFVEDRWVLHAQSERSASMFRRALRIEPGQLGMVSFSWKVLSLVDGADVRESELGDAPVRVMLAFEGDPARLSQRTRMMFDLMHTLSGEKPPFATLMYVWDNQASVDSLVINRRSDRVRKIVLESGPAHLAQWRGYLRDVVADYRRAFGEDPGALIGIAVMTDSDNTQTQAEAWYGEIKFEYTQVVRQAP
jgi:hypothetical protein